MQQQFQSRSYFSERTEKLAAALGITLRELGPRINISPAMLFAYRSGKNEISGKAWNKLAEAEQQAGLVLNVTFAHRLRAEMAKRGLDDYAKFGQEVGLSEESIRHYLSGRVPQTEELQKLASFLGLTNDELLRSDELLAQQRATPEAQREAQALGERSNKEIAAALRKLADQLDPPPPQSQHQQQNQRQ